MRTQEISQRKRKPMAARAPTALRYKQVLVGPDAIHLSTGGNMSLPADEQQDRPIPTPTCVSARALRPFGSSPKNSCVVSQSFFVAPVRPCERVFWPQIFWWPCEVVQQWRRVSWCCLLLSSPSVAFPLDRRQPHSTRLRQLRPFLSQLRRSP